MLLKREPMKEKKSNILTAFGITMEEERKKFVRMSVKNLDLITSDELTRTLMSNQTKLYNIAYHMYEHMEEEQEPSIALLTENIVIIGINLNLIELAILLKTAKEEEITAVVPYIVQELNMSKGANIEEIYNKLRTENEQDVKTSEENYQKVLRMKGDKHE